MSHRDINKSKKTSQDFNKIMEEKQRTDSRERER